MCAIKWFAGITIRIRKPETNISGSSADMYFIKLSPKLLLSCPWIPPMGEFCYEPASHQCLPDPSIMHSVCIKEDQVSQTISFLISPTWRLKTNVSVNLRNTWLNLSILRRKGNFFYLPLETSWSKGSQIGILVMCTTCLLGHSLFIFTHTYPPCNLPRSKHLEHVIPLAS